MLIVVLGGGIDLQGTIPLHVKQRLDKAIELYQKHRNAKIALCGKYSFLHSTKPKITESQAMKKYVLTKQIPRSDIYIENHSKDTIGNAYYLKKYVVVPHHETHLIVVASWYHMPRIQYIFEKYFDSRYHIEFVKIEEHIPQDRRKVILDRQHWNLKKTQELLASMKRGDDSFLAHKIYRIPYYKEKRPDWLVRFVAHGK